VTLFGPRAQLRPELLVRPGRAAQGRGGRRGQRLLQFGEQADFLAIERIRKNKVLICRLHFVLIVILILFYILRQLL
jgi:hypothetical protein